MSEEGNISDEEAVQEALSEEATGTQRSISEQQESENEEAEEEPEGETEEVAVEEKKKKILPPPIVKVELQDEVPMTEVTLCLIKPEAVRHAKKIKKLIHDGGFVILQERQVLLTPEQVSELYSHHYGNIYFPLLVAHLSSAPVIAFCLSKVNAIEEWKLLMGPKNVQIARKEYPKTLRAKFGDPVEQLRNGLHGSDSAEMAEKELHFFFPEMILDPVARAKIATFYLAEIVNPVLIEGLTQVCKFKPVDPVIWLADWLLKNNPNRPKANELLLRLPT